jgi:thioesterase domain-containing protein
VALERVAGRPVSAATLQRCRTLRGLARHLGGAGTVARLALLHAPLEPTPVLLAPPLFSRAGDLAALAAALGTERRVYALEAAGDTLDEACAALVEGAVETLEGGRRCVLVGSSFGGAVAHVVAAGLTARGFAVPRVVMFDAYHPDGYAADERPPAGGELGYVAALLAASLRVPLPAADLPTTLHQLLPPYRRLLVPGADVTTLQAALVRAARWLTDAGAHLCPGPALRSTDLTYVCAAERHPENQNAARWSGLYRSADVVTVPGDHFAVLRSAAALVPQVLPARLD